MNLSGSRQTRSLEDDKERPHPERRQPGGHFKVHKIQMFGSQASRLAAGIVSTIVVVGFGAAAAVYYSSDKEYSLEDVVGFFGGL
jgi:hypothetical protein